MKPRAGSAVRAPAGITKWAGTALAAAALTLAAGWAVVYLPPTVTIVLVASAFAATLWLQAPALALYGLAAICPFDLSYSIGGIDGVSVKDALLLALGISAVTIVAAGSPRRLRLKTPPADRILLLWLFLLVWGSVTFLLGPANQWLLRGPINNAWYVYGDIGRSLLIFPLVLVCLQDRQSIERVLDLLVVVGTGVALNAIFLTEGSDSNATGHFATGNALSGYLVLVIPFALARLLIVSSWAVRGAHAAAAIVMLRAVWLAGSRGGLVALLVSLLPSALLVPRRRIVSAGAVGLLGLSLLVATRGDLLDRPMIKRFIVLKSVQDVETFQWRQEQWDLFIQRIMERPWLGTGSDVDESMRDLDRARTAHNAFLALSVKSGIPAAVAWGLVLLALGGVAVVRSVTSIEPSSKAFWVGTLGFLVALVVHNMVESTLITLVTQHIFWIITACALLRAGAERTSTPGW